MARRVDLNDIKEAIQTIEEDGGVILTKFSGIADIEKVNRDAAPFISTIMTDVSVSFHSSPITHSPLEDICHPKVSHIIDEASHQRASKALPPETTRCTRLFGRSTTARETWLQQPSLQAILKHFLRTVSKPDHWKEEDAARLATDPILSAASTLSIGPDVKAQSLHRDDFIWQQTHKTEQKTYNLGSDVGMGLLVAGVKTTKSNGATLFVPGSHLWAGSRPMMMEEAEPAELEVGEAFLFLASTAHAGGANITEHSRTVHGFFFCRSYLRPEENQHLWWTKDEVLQWSIAAQKQAGYLIDHPFLGYCDETDPITNFRANEKA
ncbi:hypothetical protein MMC21_006255 [Puttea exsequens]|nr:hypothetical protein [Puttea exsequens]